MAEVNDIYLARMICTLGEQVGINVRHYICTAKVGQGGTDLEFANALAALLSPAYPPLMSAQANYQGLEVQKILPGPPFAPVASVVGAGPGIEQGDPLPRQCSGLISLRTAFVGRAYRGRLYMPFPAESSNEAALGVPTANYVIALVTLADRLTQPISTPGVGDNNTFTPAVFHRSDSTVTFVSGAQAKSAWATQRRRGSFGRPNTVTSTAVTGAMERQDARRQPQRLPSSGEGRLKSTNLLPGY